MNNLNGEPAGNGDGVALSPDFEPLTAEAFDLIQRVHHRLIQEMDLQAIARLEVDAARQAVEGAVRSLVSELAPHLYGEERELTVKGVVDDAIGMGPIEPLLADPSLSEVMVNAPDEVYFERDGIIYLSDVRFRDKEHILRVIDRIISPLGRRLDEASPYVDALRAGNVGGERVQERRLAGACAAGDYGVESQPHAGPQEIGHLLRQGAVGDEASHAVHVRPKLPDGQGRTLGH